MAEWHLFCDEHVHPVLVHLLKDAGFDVETVEDDVRKGIDDEEIASYVERSNRILVTNDTDFLRSVPETGVIYYPEHDENPKKILRALESLRRYVEPEEIRGNVIYVPGNWV